MREPKWLQKSFLLAIHERMLSEFGGGAGLRDAVRLDAALERPIQAHGYGMTNLYALAASHASAIIQDHPFIDGNKRTGFIAAIAFLELNDKQFKASETDVVVKTLALAASKLSEEGYAKWLEASCK